jgi:murein DD-endopeptidase MepM/ murein hydrolase activator NlpD
VIAAAVTVSGAAVAGAVTFLPHKSRAAAPDRALASGGALAAGGHSSALTAGLTLGELSKSEYAARAAASTHARTPLAGAGAAGATKRKHHQRSRLAAPVYLNPLRAITGLIPQRIDMGADFAGTGPVYPIGNAVITSATGVSTGWPGGGWITYQLTDGPGAGLVVYVAEDVRPTVAVGQKVSPTTVIATMFSGSEGIETGWAMPDGASAESQLPEAGSIGGAGPFPTRVGVSFDELLIALGVPAAPNVGDSPFGLLPASYPAGWPGVA